MPKYIIDVYLDGYDSDEEAEKACDDALTDALHDAFSSYNYKKIKVDKISEIVL